MKGSDDVWSEMSYNKNFNRNNEVVTEHLDYDDTDLYIYSYGVYENLTACNTFGVEKAFNCDEFEK